MAVMPNFPGVIARILVNGVPLIEHIDEEDDEATSPSNVIRYVECASGAKFSIQYSIASTVHAQYTIKVEILLDGKWADSAVHFCERRTPHPTTFHGARSEENGVWLEKAFQFAELVTSR